MSRRNTLHPLTLLNLAALSIIAFITIYPFINMIAVSLSGTQPVLSNQVFFWPVETNLDVYRLIARDPRIFNAYRNTVVYTISGTALALLFTVPGAYALSKKERCPFAGLINRMIIIAMFFSGGMIPGFLAIQQIGIYNTIWAVILPGAVSIWNLILMRTFFRAFPVEIEESGRLDGLSDLGVLIRLVLPTSTAIIATIGLFYGVSHWNAFFIPFIYLNDASRYPLQVVLRDIVLLGTQPDAEIVLSTGSRILPEQSLKFGAIVVSILPIIVVYPFLQKYFVKGVMIGAIKG